jgi:DNA-directed RNA polymerase specialized sigma24 family protein
MRSIIPATLLHSQSQPSAIKRRQLMQHAEKGDGKAFRALIGDIDPRVTNSLRRRTANLDELEEVCQEKLSAAIYESRHAMSLRSAGAVDI